MRFRYPDEILKEIEEIGKYIIINLTDWEVKPEAPEGTRERYIKVREAAKRYREEHNL